MIKNTSEKVNYEEKIKEENIDYKKALVELIKNMNDEQSKKLYKKALYILYKK